MEFGFKVVAGPSRLSCIFDSYLLDSDVAIVYPVKEWVTPSFDCGPLCVFETRQAANLFVAHLTYKRPSVKYQIVPCLYIPETKEQRIWIGEVISTMLYILPIGTRLARAVACLK